MYSNAKAGDPALRRVEVRLNSRGWSSITVNVAEPCVIERVTATRVIIDGRQFIKSTGREHGGSAQLVHVDNPADRYGNELEIMTWEQIGAYKREFDRFDNAFRYLHTNPKITQYCVYRAFKDKSLRQSILLLEEQFRAAVNENLEAYNVKIETGR